MGSSQGVAKHPTVFRAVPTINGLFIFQMEEEKEKGSAVCLQMFQLWFGGSAACSVPTLTPTCGCPRVS